MSRNEITIEDARLVFRNFSGEEGKFNPKGNRNFSILLSQEDAEYLRHEGWNVKYLKPREEDDIPQPYLTVKVKFDNYPPSVYLITSNGKTKLNADEVQKLDYAECERADLTITGYNWEVNGKTGIAAYLKTLYFTAREDALAKRYSNVPDTALDAISSRDNNFGIDSDKLPF